MSFLVPFDWYSLFILLPAGIALVYLIIFVKTGETWDGLRGKWSKPESELVGCGLVFALILMIAGSILAFVFYEFG